jgi:hypothetical protein
MSARTGKAGDGASDAKVHRQCVLTRANANADVDTPPFRPR